MFTEFYCDTTGSNVNGGSDAGSPSMSDTAGTGAVNAATHVYTSVATTGAVAVGQFISIYSGAATVATFIARITTVSGGSGSAWVITYSATAKSGTEPSTGATFKAQVGGAWKGPNAAVAHPFGFITNTLTDAAGDPPRVNFKSGTNYAITAVMTHSNTGPIVFQGYTTTVGDGGRATIDGGTSGVSYQLLTTGTGSSRSALEVRDMIFQNNGATGAAHGVYIPDGGFLFIRCVFNSVRGVGWFSDGNNGFGNQVMECEAYACNQSNTGNYGGFRTDTFDTFLRCISHDNTGSNSHGFVLASTSTCESCIADTNGSHGFRTVSGTKTVYRNCDAYNNTGAGFYTDTGLPITIILESCNAIKNGTWGVFNDSGTAKMYFLSNCGFGAGTMANTSGATSFIAADSVVNENAVTYASNTAPWVDPANGDFRINLATAINAGRGSFTQTAASYAGTIGYPDIGAAQHLESAGGGVSGSRIFVGF